eukprot:1813609-Prymnesium_polylepis.1
MAREDEREVTVLVRLQEASDHRQHRLRERPGTPQHPAVPDARHAHRLTRLVLAAKVGQGILQLHGAAQRQHNRARLAVNGDHEAGP